MRIAIDINDVIRDNLTQFKNCYNKFVDDDFDIKTEDIKSFDLSNVFPFSTKKEFNDFKYNDYAYELFARAEPMDKMLPYKFNDWLQNTMRDFDKEQTPEIFLFSPLEMGLTIQATYSFLSKIGCRCREMLFPIDSYKVWDKCDIMITANPNLLTNVPEGKIAIRIQSPYNMDGINCKYTFSSLMDVMNDKDETLNKMITGKCNE
jgi:hypothetical protein